ncbi:MAG: ribonuclease III [Clostridia bacterium]|nr:ribonuclease III [Clostridia bacterium]
MNVSARIIYTDAQVREMPVLALAHIGDGVYELLARMKAVREGTAQVNVLHKRTVQMVSAEAQAKATRRIREILTDSEQSVLRRGRNAKPHHAPPHKTAGDVYPMATALEALFGYLYLLGQDERISQLWDECEKSFEEQE